MQEQLPEAKMRLTGSFHLTMKFLGSVQADDVPKIQEALKAVKFDKIDLELDGLGIFKMYGRVRVVWIGLNANEALFDLQKKVEEALNPLGFEREKRPFKAHLTLARVKFADDKKFEREFEELSVESLKCSLDSFSLMQSVLKRTGAEYMEVEKFKIK